MIDSGIDNELCELLEIQNAVVAALPVIMDSTVRSLIIAIRSVAKNFI